MIARLVRHGSPVVGLASASVSAPAVWLVAVSLAAVAGCRPAVSVENPSPFDEDDPAAAREAPELPTVEPEGEPWRRLRADSIERARLDAMLDAGPGVFLRGVEISPRFRARAFAGWEIVQFMPGETRFDPYDLRPGDVILAINGQRIERPQHLQALWDTLRTADAVVVQVERDGAAFEIRFDVVSAPPARGIVTP